MPLGHHATCPPPNSATEKTVSKQIFPPPSVEESRAVELKRKKMHL